VLTYAAAVTSSIALGTGVLVASYRNPVMVAKIVATLDVLSGGRTILGVGVGWQRDEFAAVGAEHLFPRRGPATNEALEVMIACWGGGMVAHSGENFRFGPVGVDPATTQRPHPPIWIGGQSRAALHRAAAFGDRWHPHDLSPEEVETRGQELDALAGRHVGRAVRLHLESPDPVAFAEQAAAYAEAGCDHIVVEFAGRSPRSVLDCGLRIAAAF
jgi:probable F420-dependent oxidoreductase